MKKFYIVAKNLKASSSVDKSAFLSAVEKAKIYPEHPDEIKSINVGIFSSYYNLDLSALDKKEVRNFKSVFKTLNRRGYGFNVAMDSNGVRGGSKTFKNQYGSYFVSYFDLDINEGKDGVVEIRFESNSGYDPKKTEKESLAEFKGFATTPEYTKVVSLAFEEMKDIWKRGIESFNTTDNPLKKSKAENFLAKFKKWEQEAMKYGWNGGFVDGPDLMVEEDGAITYDGEPQDINELKEEMQDMKNFIQEVKNNKK